jgi:predicted transcriptional regulator
MKFNAADTELKVMEVVWQNNGAHAIDIANRMTAENGWKKNTTYTLISRLVEKKAIERIEPNYFCKPLISKDDVVRSETASIIDRICKGSKKMFLSAFLEDADISEEEIRELKDIVNKLR